MLLTVAGEAACEVIGQAQRELDDRQGRVREADAREAGRAADVEIADAVDAAIGIDDAAAGVPAHTRAAHVMVAADLVVRRKALDAADPRIEPDSPDTAGREFRAEQLGS